MAVPLQQNTFSTPTRKQGAGGKMYSQQEEYDWYLNNGLKGANDYANMVRTQYGPDSERMLAEFEQYVQQTRPDIYEQYQNDKSTGSQSGYGPGQRANLLLGTNIGEAEKTEQELNDLALSDYTYDPATEQGAGYQLPDRIEHTGRAADLSFADLQEQAIDQGRTDTTGIDAQKGVLGEMARTYAEGGLNATDRARMAQAQQMRRTQARGDREAVMQRMEQMGRAGGNAEMLSQLQANASAENALAMDDLQTQALGLERKDRLLQGQATVGAGIQSAQDAIDQFNTLGRRDIEMRRNEAEKAGRSHTYDENAARDRTFTGERNSAHGAQFAEDSARDTRNTDRYTESRRFNVQAGQGRRGMIMDRSAARGITAGARQNAAAGLTGYQGQKDAQSAAQDAALIGLAGTGAEVGGQIYGATQDDEDEEE